jgi:hypothetical protein
MLCSPPPSNHVTQSEIGKCFAAYCLAYFTRTTPWSSNVTRRPALSRSMIASRMTLLFSNEAKAPRCSAAICRLEAERPSSLSEREMP